MKNKRKQISNEISIRILSVVITIFVIFSIVVAIMIGNISLSSQKANWNYSQKLPHISLKPFLKSTQLPRNRWLSIPIYGKS